jgi:hypothetical protein
MTHPEDQTRLLADILHHPYAIRYLGRHWLFA